MTLGELRDAIATLLESEEVGEDDRIGIEFYGSQLDVNSIMVIVASDLWEEGMVVMTADYMTLEEGEADDG